MTIRRIVSFVAVLCALAAGAAALAEGRSSPDFSGTWEGPGFDLAPPEKGRPGPVVNASKDIQHPEGDYTNPWLQPWAAKQVRFWAEESHAGRAPAHAHALCLPTSVPGVMTLHQGYQFLQEADRVTILINNQSQYRHIYLNVPHSKPVKPSWYGESVGHYEGGDTLVIDTIGQTDRTFADNYRTPHTTQMHVIERWKLAADGKSVDVSVNVEDPGAFAMPYRGQLRWRRVQQRPLDEVICAENNSQDFVGFKIAIPQASKPDF
jgi:hypothetical protein